MVFRQRKPKPFFILYQKLQILKNNSCYLEPNHLGSIPRLILRQPMINMKANKTSPEKANLSFALDDFQGETLFIEL